LNYLLEYYKIHQIVS